MYIYTALNDEEDKKDLGGRTHTDDEGVYGHMDTASHDTTDEEEDLTSSRVCASEGEV